MRNIYVLLALAPLAVAGCANTLVSDDDIRDRTATNLGIQADAVRITDRHFDGLSNTYYTAETPRGSYSCILNGGTVMTLGIVYPVACQLR